MIHCFLCGNFAHQVRAFSGQHVWHPRCDTWLLECPPQFSRMSGSSPLAQRAAVSLMRSTSSLDDDVDPFSSPVFYPAIARSSFKSLSCKTQHVSFRIEGHECCHVLIGRGSFSRNSSCYRAHSNVWFSHPRGYGKGSRQWCVGE